MEKYQTALSPVLKEVSDVLVAIPPNDKTYWGQFVWGDLLQALHDSTQAHLKDCARCRFQSKIQPRKAPKRGAQAAPEVLKALSHDELASLCDDGVPSVTAQLEDFLGLEIGRQCEEMTAAMEKSRPSPDNRAFITNYTDTHRELSLSNARDVCEESSKWIAFFKRKQPLVDEVERQEGMVQELKEYYKKHVLPMSREAKRRHAISNSTTFVVEPEVFVDMVDDKIARENAGFKTRVLDWERDNNNTPFEIDGHRWNDLPDLTLLGEGRLPNKADSLNVLPSDSVSQVAGGDPGTPQRKPRTPVKAGAGAGRPKSPMPRKTSSTPNKQGTPSKGGKGSEPPADDLAPYGIPVTQPPSVARSACHPRFNVLDRDDDEERPNVSVLKASGEGVDASISVCVRVRPLVSHERKAKHKPSVKALPDGRSIQLTQHVNNKDKLHNMTFALVCDGSTTQPQLYSRMHIKGLLDTAMKGLNATCFAYGQTGSGKTFSMAGPIDVLGLQKGAKIEPGVELPALARNVLEEMLDTHLALQGIMPQISSALFQEIAALEKADENVRYVVKASYLEIYNERVQDLLTTQVENLQVREYVDGRVGFYVDGLIEREVNTMADLNQVFVDGTQNRMVTSHEMNSESSRSHAILSLKIQKKAFDKAANTIWVHNGKLTLVDLAGSESVKLTKTKGQALQETAGINKSLLALSNVISTLSEKGQDEQVTFRNSKLTMLLMDSLVGAGKTMMLACCSPSSQYLTETLSTLQFATKAANISKQVVASLTPHEMEVARLKEQIDQLRAENDALKKALADNNIPLPAVGK